jgi:AcrR family transcriptional regulator
VRIWERPWRRAGPDFAIIVLDGNGVLSPSFRSVTGIRIADLLPLSLTARRRSSRIATEGRSDPQVPKSRVKRKPSPSRTTTAISRNMTPSQADRLKMVALDLFSKRDFASVTIKDIAKSARLNSALIYYYFRDKEDLFKASIEYAIRLALENYAHLKGRHTNPVDLINDWFDNNLEIAGALRKLLKIMLDYSNSIDRLPSVDALIKRFYKEETSILSSGVRRGIAIGIFSGVDPDRAAKFASVHLDGIFVASIIRANFDIRAAMDSFRGLFWNHVRYGGRADIGSRRERFAAIGR